MAIDSHFSVSPSNTFTYIETLELGDTHQGILYFIYGHLPGRRSSGIFLFADTCQSEEITGNGFIPHG